jgi:hypothetical protein
MIQGDFDNNYRKWLNNQESPSEDEFWEAIEDNLDFNDVWNRIETNLDKNLAAKKIIFRLNFSIVAQYLLVFFLFIPKTIYDSFDLVKKNCLIAVNNNFNSENITKNSNLVNEIKNSSSHNFNEIGYESQNLAFTSQINTSESSLKLLNNNSFDYLENLDSLSLNLDTLTDKQTQTNCDINFVTELKLKSSNNVDSSSKNPKFKIIDAGLIYSFKNTWLLNDETKSGFNPNKLNNTLLTWHRSWGINSTFQIKNKHLVGLEFFWKSFSGQNYQEYINASFASSSIRLQYISFQTFYIYKTNYLPGSFLIGAYFSDLQMAQKQFANEIIDIKNNYTEYDFGTMLGYQIHYKISSSFVIKASYRFNYSLYNIYKGNNLIGRDLNKTTSMSNSLNLSLNYIFN